MIAFLDENRSSFFVMIYILDNPLARNQLFKLLNFTSIALRIYQRPGGSFAKISPTEKIPVPGDCGYFLHASRLSFAHPQTLQQMNFECPTPQRWQEVCRSI